MSHVKFSYVRVYGGAGGSTEGLHASVDIQGHARTIAEVQSLIEGAPDLAVAAEKALAWLEQYDPKAWQEIRGQVHDTKPVPEIEALYLALATSRGAK